jgi:hypothetical protein
MSEQQKKPRIMERFVPPDRPSSMAEKKEAATLDEFLLNPDSFLPRREYLTASTVPEVCLFFRSFWYTVLLDFNFLYFPF